MTKRLRPPAAVATLLVQGIDMASQVAAGVMIAAPTPRAGQIAPKM